MNGNSTQNLIEGKNSGDNLFCVGIGASAGGLEAIETFFKNMPENSGLAFVIIQHLSPDYKSLMGELLSRYTRLPIKVAADGMAIEANTIYLIPPKKNMTIFGKRLLLADQEHNKGLNLPIDIFFRSLAVDMGKNSIGIVLSGTGSDGALGIRAIKEAGGMIMVQDSESAKFDGMPRSSIATGIVDYILPPEQMPETLLRYIKHPFIIQNEHARKEISNDSALLRILRVVRDKTNVDFTYYKPNTILRRLEKRLGINQIDNFREYLEFLEQSPNEVHILYKDLLIGVTQFFRDQDAFEVLGDKLIPLLFANKPEGSVIRIWSAGCSTGEEAYSLAILLLEYMEKSGKSFDVKLFATDLDRQHIEIAGNGFYPESIITDVSPERLEKYFIKKNGGYQVNEKLRRMVIYAQQNIIKDPPFSKIDLITCRNMLIYLNQEMQRKIISMFYYSLVPGGGLFLGSSETLGDMSNGFDTINNKWKIFRQKPGYKPAIVANYLMPLTPRSRTFKRQDFSYLEQPARILSDNVLSDLLQMVMPPSVIVNDEFQIVHVFKEVDNFLRINPGKASLNVLGMMKKELSVVVSSMLHKAASELKQVIFRKVKISDRQPLIDISVIPLNDKITKKHYFVISFSSIEVPSIDFTEVENFDFHTQISERYNELEKELQFTKENLQATIEELETSNEELQSTNEELVASNEELQSTNEELQSVNEELYTVNSEYQRKIEELTELNNDISNLLKTTEIGILFLDKNLCIRKFTNLISRLINIIDLDIGRPISHISLNIEYPGFMADIERVRDTLLPHEFEFFDKDGHWNLMKILPYRTSDNAIDGITITIVDITTLKKSQLEIKRNRDLFYRILENSPSGKIMIDDKGRITYANLMAQNIFNLKLRPNEKQSYSFTNMKFLDQDGNVIPEDRLPYPLLMKGIGLISLYYHTLVLPDGTQRFLTVSGSPMFDEKNNISGAVLTYLPITREQIANYRHWSEFEI